VVVSQKLVQEINSLVGNVALVLGVDKQMPALAGESSKNIVVLRIKLNIVLVEVIKELLGSKNLGNLDELVGVGVSMEEGFLAEDHGCEHSSERPEIKRVVVFLVVDEQLGTLEVTGCDAYIVLSSGVVELGKTPIDQSQLYIISHIALSSFVDHIRTLRFS
jgi:hypothetical protein